MVSYVLDSSVVIKWFINEEDSEKAEKYLIQLEEGKIDIFIPDSLYYECANVFWVRRPDGITLDDALYFLEELLSIEFKPVLPLDILTKAQALSFKEDISIYDSVFLALAELKNCEFITADKRLYNKIRERFPYVKFLREI